jgi:cytosine deaminase
VTTLLLRNARLADGRMVDVRIDGEEITAVSPAVAGGATGDPSARVVDVGGRLLTPAFVEPHAHLDKALSADRVPNPSGDLAGAISAWHAYAPQLTVADMAERGERCARMLVANGVTAIRTHADVHDAVGLRAVEALLDVRERLAGIVDVTVTALLGCPTTGAEGEPQRARLREAIAMGVDCVGGCPYLEPDPADFVDFALDRAGAAGLGLDLHMDETCDTGVLTLELLAARVVATGFASGVLAGHCVSLGLQPPDVQRRIADAVAEAGIHVIALPQTNLYLQGRDAAVPPRGLTAIKVLQAAGANVAAGGDNVQDPFNPVGRGDPLETAALLVMAGHLQPDDAFAAVSTRAGAAIGRPPMAVEAGAPAELVGIPAASRREAVATGPPGRLVVHRGRVVAGA